MAHHEFDCDRGRQTLAAMLALALSCTEAPAPRAPAPGLEAAPAVALDAGATREGADGGALRPLFLGEVEVVNHPGTLPAGTDEPVVITLEPSRAAPRAFDELARRTGAKTRPTGALTFEARGYPFSSDAVVAGVRGASFVLDYDEPPVKQARAEAVRLCGPAPTMDQLGRFVARYIVHKDMERGFDIASQVARRKEGDCTEHAVLLAALARSFGFPARVVFGLVIVRIEGKLLGFGHAWVEYHDGARWRPADAAVPPEAGPSYLPMHVLGDEGPAFTRHMIEATGALVLVRRIVFDPVAPAAR